MTSSQFATAAWTQLVKWLNPKQWNQNNHTVDDDDDGNYGDDDNDRGDIDDDNDHDDDDVHDGDDSITIVFSFVFRCFRI